MLKHLIDRDPLDYLKLLLITLLVLAFSVVLFASAEFLMPPGLLAETLALVAFIAAALAILVASIAFLMIIVVRLRTIFRIDNDD